LLIVLMCSNSCDIFFWHVLNALHSKNIMFA
jgi:hypothetical protein